MRCNKLFMLMFFVLLLVAVSASFEYYPKENTITTQYETGDLLNAYLNMSFFNESLDSNFTDSLGNLIRLGDLLDNIPEYSYIYYDLSNTTISAAPQIIDMGKAGFVMPNQIKNFTYKLYLDGKKIFSDEFQILSDKNLIVESINKKEAEINRTKEEILEYGLYVQEALNDLLNLDLMEEKLNEIRDAYYASATSGDYSEVLKNLSDIKIPKSISEGIITSTPITFYPSQDNINLKVLGEITGGDYNEANEKEYKDAIYLWNDQNVRVIVNFNEINIDYGSNEESTLRVFKFDLNKGDLQEDAYLIIKDMENMKFYDLEIQPEETFDGYKYFLLKDLPDTVIFSTTEDVNFLNIPLFISPPLASIKLPDVGPVNPFESIKKSKWFLFVVIAVILFIIGVITYILIQIWYRRKYEKYLFKDRNNLYNIMTFIHNAKKKGLKREEILKELRKTRWTGEQINYALNKYEGKRIKGLIKMPMNMGTGEEVKKMPPRNPGNMFKK